MKNNPEVSTAFRPKFDPPKVSAVGFVLDVIGGPDVGTRFSCNAGSIFPILIGQSSSCEFRVKDPSVSRRHLSLELDGNRLRIEDLRSRNGTLLNGASTQAAWLQGGEALVLGGTHIKVSLEETAEVAPLPLISSFGRTIGASAEMRRLYAMLSRLAKANIPVLIEGETGTGKEILAESIHEESPRANGPFVVFDCTTVAPNLIESELFGHERGAFTGATQTRVGVFEQANGGTLLIDEIGDLDRSLQPKLLRVLERAEVRRVGGNKSISVDVRVLAATRRDLDREVSEGRFRDDLYHRLAVGRVELPPLRRRPGDISILVQYFVQQLGADIAKIPAAQIALWEDAPWPGNIRELRNAIARYLALGESELFAPLEPMDEPSADAPPGQDIFGAVIEQNLPLVEARRRVVDAFEQVYIADVLRAHGGHVGKAAAASGIARRHFQRVRNRGGQTP
jgi:DNA-binding NtrC family response regulator